MIIIYNRNVFFTVQATGAFSIYLPSLTLPHLPHFTTSHYTYMQTHPHPHPHTRTHTRTYTHRHTQTHTHTHIYIYFIFSISLSHFLKLQHSHLPISIIYLYPSLTRYHPPSQLSQSLSLVLLTSLSHTFSNFISHSIIYLYPRVTLSQPHLSRLLNLSLSHC
jgi:hypothetical protein